MKLVMTLKGIDIGSIRISPEDQQEIWNDPKSEVANLHYGSLIERYAIPIIRSSEQPLFYLQRPAEAIVDVQATARNIRKHRELQGWTQKRVAKLIRVGVSAYGTWESGKIEPYPDAYFALCKLFGTVL